MTVLLVTFSKKGSTTAIGDAIAETLREEGLDVERRSFGIGPAEVMAGLAPEAISAAVVGGAVYMNAWVPPAVTAQRTLLAAGVRTHAFAVGMAHVTPEPGDPRWLAPRSIGNAQERVTFAGTVPTEGLSLKERAVLAMVRAEPGEHTDWDAVRTWAHGLVAAIPGG